MTFIDVKHYESGMPIGTVKTSKTKIIEDIQDLLRVGADIRSRCCYVDDWRKLAIAKAEYWKSKLGRKSIVLISKQGYRLEIQGKRERRVG